MRACVFLCDWAIFFFIDSSGDVKGVDEQEALAGHKMIKVTVGGQDVALDLSRTLAQSGIRPGSTLKLKLTGLLGGGGNCFSFSRRPAPATTASASGGASTAAAAAATTASASVGFPQGVLETDPTKSEQDIGDFKMRLRLRIAADPEAFFALADTTQDDSLSLPTADYGTK